MHGQCRRQAGRDFLGERWAGDHGQRHVVATPAVAEDVARDLMQEAAAAGLETLGRPRHAGMRRTQGRQRVQGLAECVRWHHHQHQVGTGHGIGQHAGGAQAFRQRKCQAGSGGSRGPRRWPGPSPHRDPTTWWGAHGARSAQQARCPRSPRQVPQPKGERSRPEDALSASAATSSARPCMAGRNVPIARVATPLDGHGSS